MVYRVWLVAFICNNNSYFTDVLKGFVLIYFKNWKILNKPCLFAV